VNARTLSGLTAGELTERLRKREVSAREAVDAALSRIEALDPEIGAFLWTDKTDAVRQADEAQTRLDDGDPAPLLGVPIAVKDNICTVGVPTTAGSRILEGYRPTYDAAVVERLRRAGMVIIGKTNLDEFAMGSSTEASAFFPAHNPWDLQRVPGGSSGGSAASVAALEAPVSLGSDTGGSIRQPAALCGVVGLKPTYGRVSRYGLIAFSSSLDQIGPLARDVTDCALLLNVLCGRDPMDSTSVDVPVPDFTEALVPDLSGVRVGVPKEFLGEGVQPGVRDAVLAALPVLEEAGASVEETSLPSTDYGVGTYYIISPAEASSNLARYDGIRYGHRAQTNAGHVHLVEQTREEGFGVEVKRRIILGTYALSAGYYDAYYLKAQKVRTKMRREFEALFERFDLVVGPTNPTVAFRLGAFESDPLAMKMADVLTIPASLAGLPAASVPCGFSDGLPVGLQIIGRPFDESAVLRGAFAYQERTEWHTMRPPMAA
jgi:aspartyl-tRNA(Asn)/glutamyl-tRNA(Gln) amidotransferase subunit A